jgi:hypothetical protein
VPRWQQNRAAMSWKDEGARNLDNLLKAYRVTNASVARALSMDDSLVSRWRSGERVPDVDQLVAVLKMVGGSADAVLGLGSAPAPTPQQYPPHLVERVMKEAERLEAAARQLQQAAKVQRKR